MGLLKRIFSIGVKKNKKRTLAHAEPSEHLEHIQEEEQEAAASRLLRSSSSRYAVVSEFNYASCPALPHPINNVIQTPGASSISLSSTSATQRGTYTVTVHRRQQHALTEFPHANPPMSDDYTTPHDSPRSRSKSIPFFPRDSNCLQGLRQDPSVASLLNMYDEHGCLPPSAFSNTPPSPAKEGRVQARRNGSTLRQLLGNPSSRSRGNVDSSAMEGDISWAERCLGETDSIASMSSLGLLETPTDLDNQFSGVHSHDDHLRRMIPIQHAYDFSHNTSGSSAISDSNYPAFSSLEVEISIVADSPPIPGSPYQSENPMTPQRASQVFGFLTEKRKSTFANDMKGPLLGLPQQHINALSSQTSHFSDSSSESLSTQTSEKPPMHVDNTRIPAQSTSVGLRRTQSQSYSPTSTNSSPHDYNPRSAHPQCRNSIPQDDILKPHQVQVIITAPTPSDDTQITRIPRGPRPSPRQYTKNLPQQPDVENGNRISLQLYDAHSTLLESTRLQNIRSGPPVAPARDPFTPIPPRQRRTHHKAMSCGPTSTFAFPESGHPPPVSDVLDTFNCAGKGSGSHGKPAYGEGKENDLTSHASFGLPVTPVRSRSLFGFSGKPSPTSSSDLSPVGQQLMMNLRQQRMSAREAERQKKGMRGSGTARVK